MRTSGTASPRTCSISPAISNDAGLYQKLAAKLGEIEKSHQTGGNVLFYLSTQPSYYGPVVELPRRSRVCSTATAGGASSSKSPSATIWPAPAS